MENDGLMALSLFGATILAKVVCVLLILYLAYRADRYCLLCDNCHDIMQWPYKGNPYRKQCPHCGRREEQHEEYLYNQKITSWEVMYEGRKP